MNNRFISLLQCSQHSGIPYITLYRWSRRAYNRGELEMSKYQPLSIRTSDFNRYLEARIKRQNSGTLELKRVQAHNALTSLQAIRVDKKKVELTDDSKSTDNPTPN